MLQYLTSPSRHHLVTFIFLLPLVFLLVHIFHRLFFHPLRHVPGSFHRRISPLPLLYSSYVGTEVSEASLLHSRYGPVVLLGPNDVSITDADAINPIYVDKGGFPKIPHYRNYDVAEHETIFSTLDNIHRAKRAKTVSSMFATSRVRSQCENGGSVEACVDDFVRALKLAREKSQKDGPRKMDVLDLCRRLAIDVVCEYMFGRRYGGFAELGATPADHAGGTPLLSAAPSVEAFVAVGRIYLLSPPIYRWVEIALSRLSSDPELEASEAKVDHYMAGIMDEVADLGDTYQSRLLDVGISPEETSAQCKDLLFAGTDGTGTNLAKLLWNLCRQPQILSRLREELQAVEGESYTASQAHTPYLHAVVKEGLRTAMANPTRLPRTVPASGWSFLGYDFPAGARVGCASHHLHFDDAVFDEPLAFSPERWLEDADGDNSDDSAKLARQRSAWMPFGAGLRQCIARNLASEELTLAIRKVVLSGVLERVSAVGDNAGHVVEWFNSKVADGVIELEFPS